MVKFELERLERLTKDLEALILSDYEDILFYRRRKGKQKDGYRCSTEGWEEARIDAPWRELDSHMWLRTRVEIPKRMAGKRVAFSITTGREGEWDATNPQMLFYLDGEILQGVDVNHREIGISDCAEPGETHEIALLAYSGSVPGDLVIHTKLVAVDSFIRKVWYDFQIPLQTARILCRADEENYRRILQMLEPAANELDLRKAYSPRFYESLERADRILTEQFYSRVRTEAPVVSAIGHTHIDIAWLWTVEQTREKVLRSFSTVLRLMEEYPDYKFMSSQPILYQFVKEQEPKLYERIRQRVAEGRWEVDGAMWLEADCNVTGGESLVRQILKGRRFFLEEFGKESKCLWLPDAFGYSAALPQILKKAGIPYFMTTKIAWNQYNQMPNDTFLWRGIDGSEVFAFMPTTCDFDKGQGLNISFSDTRNTTTYTGIMNPNMTLGTYKRFQNRDLTEDTLMLFGFGDGGGGPTWEMLESAKRLKYGMPGIPRIAQEFEGDFFDRTYEKIAKLPNMPTWDGELYFEYHRGTLTSMAKNKRNNRKNEILYSQLETLSCMAQEAGVAYPARTIQEGWDVLLLNQFHDIIPGSCVGPVYDVTDQEYEAIRSAAQSQLQDVAVRLADQISIDRDAVVVFNTQGYRRDDVVFVDSREKRSVSCMWDGEGGCYPAQPAAGGGYLFFAGGIPSVGYKVFYPVFGEPEKEPAAAWDGTFENEYYRAVFDEKMRLVSLVEKQEDREFIREGEAGNMLLTYEDRPMNWDNWDIDVFYQKKPYEPDWIGEPRLVEQGPVRLVVEYSMGFEDSVITQQVHLYRHLPRIDFRTRADWREHHVLLRVNFPVNVNATKAAYEIQFGNVERETTNNQSWDSAKFEACGHKWADLSENSGGISLLNDCKYGYGIKGGNLSLTLIKAGTYPNENADIGAHEFTYSIYPHRGRWQEARTVEMAYDLNVPVIAVERPAGEGQRGWPEERSILSCDKENCFVEALKAAEDGEGMILRMYENRNGRTRAAIRLGRPVRRVWECDLLERNLSEIPAEGDRFTALFRPFEIKTFRLVF